MQRYFSIKLKDNKLFLNNEDLYHIRKVMRMTTNNLIEVVFDNKVYVCTIYDINEDNVKIKEEINLSNELNKDITIAFPILKEEKIDFILQKCCEIGVNKFIPTSMERCLVKINEKADKKIQRWNKILKEASEQSRRNIIPEITNINSINDLIKLDYDLKLICSLHETSKNLKNVLQNNTFCDKIIIVSGPEGGFTSKEEEILTNGGFIRVSIGKTVKRAESAPIYMSSAISYEFMED